MEYLISRIFNKYIKDEICFVTEYNEKKFINCKKDKIIEEKDIFPAVVFVVEKYGFKLTYEDLFIDSIKENELIFIIQKNYYDIDTSIILFGSRIFKKYLIEFDMEKYNIIVHSENVLPIINLDIIEDDFWRDLIRDYNKEIEHYDSNYGKEDENIYKEKNIDVNIKNNNNHTDNPIKDNKSNNTNNKNKTDSKNDDKNEKDENKKFKIEIDYNILIVLFWILFGVVILVGICVFLHFRKKIRIEKEKKYFNQPLSEEKNNEE
jgi:hypothetical protein